MNKLSTRRHWLNALCLGLGLLGLGCQAQQAQPQAQGVQPMAAGGKFVHVVSW